MLIPIIALLPAIVSGVFADERQLIQDALRKLEAINRSGDEQQWSCQQDDISRSWNPSGGLASLNLEKVCDAPKRDANAFCEELSKHWHEYFSDSVAVYTSVNRRIAVYKYASRIFEQVKTDSEYLQMCCLDDEKCKKRVGGIELIISDSSDFVKALKKRNEAYYHSFKNKIFISSFRLSRCAIPECVEYLIWHEMGHVCQFNRYRKTKLGRGLMNDFVFLKSDIGLKGFDELIGLNSDQVACIKNGVKKSYADHKGKKNLGYWYTEAYADLMFLPKKVSPAHWMLVCNGMTDLQHGPGQPIMDCLFEDDSFVEKMCQSPSK